MGLASDGKTMKKIKVNGISGYYLLIRFLSWINLKIREVND